MGGGAPLETASRLKRKSSAQVVATVKTRATWAALAIGPDPISIIYRESRRVVLDRLPLFLSIVTLPV